MDATICGRSCGTVLYIRFIFKIRLLGGANYSRANWQRLRWCALVFMDSTGVTAVLLVRAHAFL